MSILSSVFKLSYQISPVILVDGLASLIPGGMLPIVTLTEGTNFITGLLTGRAPKSLDDFYAHWRPLSGTQFVRQEIGSYPFANQAVAANATIQQPLPVSMLMACPARGDGAYLSKLMTMQSLFAAINQHNNSGGTYAIAMPSGLITGLILRSITDVSGDDAGQVQSMFRWDFEKPLISDAQAQQALSSLMSKLSGGVATPLSWSGLSSSVGTTVSAAASGVSSSFNGVAASLTSQINGASQTIIGTQP